MPKILESIADQLTPEEVAAFEADDEIGALEAIDALGEEPDDAETEDDFDDDDDAEPEARADDDIQAGQDDPDPEPEPAKAAPPPEPEIDVDAIKEEIAVIDKAISDLGEARENLEITKEAYDARMLELAEMRGPLSVQLKTAATQAEAVKQEWFGAVRGYLGANPGLNDGGDVLQAFDRAVRSITGNPKFANLSNDEVLARAHTLLTTQADVLGITVPPVRVAAKAKAAKSKAKPKAEGEEALGKVVPTLAKTPASEVSSLNDSPHAQLELIFRRGNAVEMEEAMRRLPKEQRDEFASMLIGD